MLPLNAGSEVMELKLKLLAVGILAVLLCAAVPLAAAEITPNVALTDTGAKVSSDVSWGAASNVGKVTIRDTTGPTIVTVAVKGAKELTQPYTLYWAVHAVPNGCSVSPCELACVGTEPLGDGSLVSTTIPQILVSDDKGNIEMTVWADPGTAQLIQDKLNTQVTSPSIEGPLKNVLTVTLVGGSPPSCWA